VPSGPDAEISRTALKLAEALGVHPKVARRLLSQLQPDGWLTYGGGARPVYAPTLRVVALAAHVARRAPLATLTAPALERLHAETGIPAMLAIPAYNRSVCIARCVGGEVAAPPLRALEPASSTAAGKVLLAHREPWRRSIFTMPPERWVDRGTVDRDALECELAGVRRDGFASAGVDGPQGQLAAAVIAPSGEVLAAIGVDRTGGDTLALSELSERVRRAGEAASAALATAAGRYPLQRTAVYRLLASYGRAQADAYL
jgi:DNA-binding IclR family transcriptional regulator